MFSPSEKKIVSKRHRHWFHSVCLCHTLGLLFLSAREARPPHLAGWQRPWAGTQPPAGHQHRATPLPRGCWQPQPWALTPALLTQLWHCQHSQVPTSPEKQRCAAGVPGTNLTGRVNRYEIKRAAGLTGCHRGSSWTIKWLSDKLVKLFWEKGAFYNLD